MSKILVVFDDTVPKSEIIRNIIGNKGFSDVIVRRRRLSEYYQNEIRKVYSQAEWYIVSSPFMFQDILKQMVNRLSDDYKVLHCFSNFMVSEPEYFELTLKKLQYIEEPYRLLDDTGHVAGVMFNQLDRYISFLQSVCKDGDSVGATLGVELEMPVRGITDIGDVNNFIRCVTGSFDSRYFNSLHGENDYSIVKTSTDKAKIKAEYTYYHLLPEDMKPWFVMPFNYREDETTACYTMQRLHMTDIAIKWVHGSFEPEEFEELLNMYFYFFAQRHRKSVSEEVYRQTEDALYVEKVESRISKLKQKDVYKSISGMLAAGGKLGNIDTIFQWYLELKQKVERQNRYPQEAVIGHGDPCFSNALYSKSTRTLKFIDPKGAVTEEALWTNPYYDIAKLSHSICGLYDFFNNGLYEITVDANLEYQLKIDFDNKIYKELFRKKAEAFHYDYLTIRIYEASLFLSMLPLHIDNPHKVFGFILNACNILKEIEENV